MFVGSDSRSTRSRMCSATTDSGSIHVDDIVHHLCTGDRAAQRPAGLTNLGAEQAAEHTALRPSFDAQLERVAVVLDVLPPGHHVEQPIEFLADLRLRRTGHFLAKPG